MSATARNSNFSKVKADYIINSRKRGISFALSDDELYALSQAACYYCGAGPSNRAKRPESKVAFIYNGVDRIDNALGYSPSNCVPCCFSCNKLKGTRSTRDFLGQIHRITGHCLSLLIKV